MTNNAPPERRAFEVIADEIAVATDTDVLYFNASIEDEADRHVIQLCRRRRRRSNILLILVTNGGDANGAYRIARCLQRNFEKFTVLVSGYCKSAGTLLAIGANEIVVSDEGELGPLDVQLLKRDELFERQSGLTLMAALEALNEQAFTLFEYFLLQTKRRGPSITARMATDIAAKITTGLFSAVYQQIDPTHMGESGRANQIAQQYGLTLAEHSGNLQPTLLKHLAEHYPWHDYVIDKEEAEAIFENVRDPNEREVRLITALGRGAVWPSEQPVIMFLSSEPMVSTEINELAAILSTGGDSGEHSTHAQNAVAGGNAEKARSVDETKENGTKTVE